MTKITIKDMRYSIEMDMSLRCYDDQKQAEAKGIKFECKCEDPYKWSDEEVIKYYEEIHK